MIDQKTKGMVLEALNDEYKARALYRLVIKTFGPVRPFINIVEAEDTHARALEALCARYGIPLPADDWEAKLQPPSSILEACRAGVAGEVENIAMYDRFLRETDLPDVRSMFQRLQARSREAHLPAFERCVARGGETGARGWVWHEATAGTRRLGCETIPSPGESRMTSLLEKGGGTFSGIKMLLCENPLPPLDEAIAAAQEELARSNYYTEAYSAPLRRLLSEQIGVPERLIHINAGSELILRQLFARLGQRVHLLTPTYVLFPEIAESYTETRLLPQEDFGFDLARLAIPAGTTLVAIVNPNNPNGGTFDMAPLPDLLARHPDTHFLVDEAFVGMAGQSVASWVPHYRNLSVTRTLSKAHSLAGFRVGYAILPEPLADDLNTHNDAYPLARPSEAAALATLRYENKIRERAALLRGWARELARGLEHLGAKTFPSETYFFLADLAPHDAKTIAVRLRERQVLVKPLNDPRLGPGYMRVTTALPEDNRRFLELMKETLASL
jgi:histidinol-phosphate aminotransferase